MAESTKLRLVRCPKCANLLPELADYAVYQCGGCGAVLRAKNVSSEAVSSPEKLVGQRLEGVSSKSQTSSEKGVVDLSDVSDADVGLNDFSLKREQRDPEKNDVERGDVSSDEAKGDGGKRAIENGHDLSRNKEQLGNSIARQNGELNSQFGNAGGSQRLRRALDLRGEEKEQVEGFRRIPRTVVEDVRFSTSKRPDEGPSNYFSDSSYGYREPMRNNNDLDGPNKAPLKQDRSELLRKLDELKEQLSRSCDLADKSREKVPIDGRAAPPEPYAGPDSWFASGSSGVENASNPFSWPEKHHAAAGPPYFNHYQDPFGYTAGHDMPRHGLYPPIHNANRVPGYGDSFGGSQMLRRAPNQLPSEYLQQPSHPYFSTQYVDSNLDSFVPYQHNAVMHQPSSSCFHCYDQNQRVSAPVPPGTNPMFYHQENLRPLGPHLRDSLTAMPPLNVRGTQAHARWPSHDINNSEMGTFVRSRPQRVVLASGGSHFRPIAGGAPFLLCQNCFELIQLPRKLQLVVKNDHKVRCGSCCTVINFSMVDKKLVIHGHGDKKGISASEVVKESELESHFHGRMSRIAANFSSDDYDNSGYDFQSVDRDPVAVSSAGGQDLNSVNPPELRSFDSSSPTSSEDENSLDVQIPAKTASLSPPPAGSPLQDHFDYSTSNHVGNRLGKGNRSSRSDQEKVVLAPTKNPTRQNSLKEASLATEMEVSFNDYANSGADVARQDDQRKTSKGGESFFANIIKKSFKDFSRSSSNEERGKSNVSVNGHPIPDRLVKKAEKMAGTIQSGKYWYDFRAGFWGVMGGPCLGIIPPFIEEFNYPMPENCGAGNTGVFVNGRELNKKDLDLLASRGLPTDRDRSYVIDISGRVLDADTGEELESLGKLAPTIEKVKHGFGMKVPRAAT